MSADMTSLEGHPPPNSVPSLPEEVQHEDICYNCGDGGSLLECNSCPAAYCYRVLSTDTSDTGPQAQGCVGLPVDTNLKNFVFTCIECYNGTNEQKPPPYEILCSFRRMRRVAVGNGNPPFVLIMLHLVSTSVPAAVLSTRVAAQIRALQIQVEVLHLLVDPIDEEKVEEFFQALPTDFHLWCMIYTESDPRGGWWIESEGDGGQASPSEVLDHLLIGTLDRFAANALTAQVVIIACGCNLFLPFAREQIIDSLQKSKWQSLIAPAAPAVYPPEFTSMLPQLVAQTTFVQFDLRTALMRSWLKQPRSRDHTNIYLFSKEANGNPPCVLMTHAPHRIRPWGLGLPADGCVCACARLYGSSSSWKLKYRTKAPVGGEVYFFFVTECCAYELHLAIFVGSLDLICCYGTELVIAPIDPRGEIEFNYGSMVTMKLMPKTAPQLRPKHQEGPWTPAGKAVVAQTSA